MDWKDKDQSEGLGQVYVTERIARIQQVEFDASKLHESQQMAAQYNMVDNGSGETQVSNMDAVNVPLIPGLFGEFEVTLFIVIYSSFIVCFSIALCFRFGGWRLEIKNRAKSP